ncbi:DoxX family protein [Acinetobacter sp. JS678]|nr:DoxX family protein [Acinetobacter sp. JS678]
MSDLINNNPVWVKKILSIHGLLPLLRLALVSAYLVGGMNKLIGFHAAIDEQASFGLQPAWLWASTAILIEIVGSLLVIFNRFVWLGAGALGCLTAIAMLVTNDFWNHTGPAFFSTFNTFFEHLGLIAALVMVTILSNQQTKSQ